MFKFLNLYYEKVDMHSDGLEKVYLLDNENKIRSFGPFEAIKYIYKFKLKASVKNGQS